jgi:hypothetical protein
MLSPVTEKLTREFYEWETRLRGWYVYEQAVDLEPGFQPFEHTLKKTGIIDDGKRPTLVSTFRDLFTQQQKIEPVPMAEHQWYEAYTAVKDEAQCVFSIAFPKGYKVPGHETEQFLLILSSCRFPVSFEIIATSEKIKVQYVCSGHDAFHLKNQLRAYFPAAVLQEQTDFLPSILNDEIHITEYGLSEEVMCPLTMPGGFDPDPFVSMFGVLDNLQDEQCAVLQVLFKHTANPWAWNILQAVSTGNGDCFLSMPLKCCPLPSKRFRHRSMPLLSVSLEPQTRKILLSALPAVSVMPLCTVHARRVTVSFHCTMKTMMSTSISKMC